MIPKNEFFSGDLDQNEESVFCVNEFGDANQTAHLSSLVRAFTAGYLEQCAGREDSRRQHIYHVGRAMRKRVFGHMRTAKAQIRLRIRAV